MIESLPSIKEPSDVTIVIFLLPSCGTNHDRDLNAAINILNRGQIDLCDSKQPSRATMEEELKIPMALMKHASKIERSGLTTGLHEDEASLTVFSC